MNSVKTDKEVRQQYISKLGEVGGNLYWLIYKDFVVLKYEWRIFSELFRAYPERIEVMNSVSGNTASIIQNALRERTIIKVCRLLDRAGDARNRNATLLSLLEEVPVSCSAMELLRDAIECSKPLKVLRNKSLAHRDILHATSDTKIGGVSYNEIDSSVQKIGQLIQRFSEEKLNTTVITNMTTGYEDDEVHFVRVLMLGQKALEEQRAKRREFLEDRNYKELEALEKLPKWLLDRRFDIFG
ncbi:hypothetical protein [Sulfitobacter pacificus]|uniref:HEPN AbiU2-like domain-containing protein n=1 Tax=Sulfitobacter pacificus TaxID=1499314 RepID=A0ABQ5VJD6_9RHOB|nr:hypothetical protein [Sulfitobacter pacificus]GLQ27235.1 hypothetical protein GCM10007927_20380 [Sulfitobacter pacificus]